METKVINRVFSKPKPYQMILQILPFCDTTHECLPRNKEKKSFSVYLLK
jgi:hypothetical protein